MGKQKKLVNWRVVVEPEPPSTLYREPNDDDWREACRDLMKKIKRHIDGVSASELQVDREFSCSFCNGIWTEDGDTYNGGCCDEDEKAAPQP